jgi:Mycoplasma protein of unknown function, DUF285
MSKKINPLNSALTLSRIEFNLSPQIVELRKKLNTLEQQITKAPTELKQRFLEKQQQLKYQLETSLFTFNYNLFATLPPNERIHEQVKCIFQYSDLCLNNIEFLNTLKEKIASMDLSGVTDMSYLFNIHPNNIGDNNELHHRETLYFSREYYIRCLDEDIFNNILEGVVNWDVSNVDNMAGMFKVEHFNNKKSIDDISKLITLSGIAINMNLDFTNWKDKLGNVRNMEYMFLNCNKFAGIGLNEWETLDNVINMEHMFSYCSNFNQNLYKWGTHLSNVLNMKSMFTQCEMFVGEGLENWTTITNVKHIGGMFYMCYSFNGNVSTWGRLLNNVVNMSIMFYDCYNFEGILMEEWLQEDAVFSHLTYAQYVFSNTAFERNKKEVVRGLIDKFRRGASYKPLYGVTYKVYMDGTEFVSLQEENKLLDPEEKMELIIRNQQEEETKKKLVIERKQQEYQRKHEEELRRKEDRKQRELQRMQKEQAEREIKDMYAKMSPKEKQKYDAQKKEELRIQQLTQRQLELEEQLRQDKKENKKKDIAITDKIIKQQKESSKVSTTPSLILPSETEPMTSSSQSLIDVETEKEMEDAELPLSHLPDIIKIHPTGIIDINKIRMKQQKIYYGKYHSMDICGSNFETLSEIITYKLNNGQINEALEQIQKCINYRRTASNKLMSDLSHEEAILFLEELIQKIVTYLLDPTYREIKAQTDKVLVIYGSIKHKAFYEKPSFLLLVPYIHSDNTYMEIYTTSHRYTISDIIPTYSSPSPSPTPSPSTKKNKKGKKGGRKASRQPKKNKNKKTKKYKRHSMSRRIKMGQ